MYRPGQLGTSTKHHWNLAIILETGWGEEWSTSKSGGSRWVVAGPAGSRSVPAPKHKPRWEPAAASEIHPACVGSPHLLPGEDGHISTGACQIPAKASKGTRESESPSPLPRARAEPFSFVEMSGKIFPMGPYLEKTLGLPYWESGTVLRGKRQRRSWRHCSNPLIHGIHGRKAWQSRDQQGTPPSQVLGTRGQSLLGARPSWPHHTASSWAELLRILHKLTRFFSVDFVVT